MRLSRAARPATIRRAARAVPFMVLAFFPASAHGGSPRHHVGVSTLDTLQVVGEFEQVQAGHVVFGDSDHDGQIDILYHAVDVHANSLTRIIERNPDGQFLLAAEVPGLEPLAIGDIDQDGRTDLVGKAGSFIRVHESADSFSHPSSLAWEVLSETNFTGRIAISDTDGDGQLEIVHRYFTDNVRIEIYECTGDNSYTFRFGSTNNPQPTTRLMSNPPDSGDLTSTQQARGLFVGDVDRDRRQEIAFSDDDGTLRVFESFANDSWTETFTGPTGLINPRVIAGGEDADANGLREIWLAGDDPEAFNRRVFIFEPTTHDSFSCIDTLTTVDGASGGQYGTLAHLDREDRWRFVWNVRRRLEIYVHKGGQWQIEKIYHDPSPNHFEIRATDLNRNGRDEILWLGNGLRTKSWILEQPTIPSDTNPELPPATIPTLRVFPSPTRRRFATVFLDATLEPRVRNWSIFDASGRLVLTQPVGRDAATGAWAMPVDRIRPGLYFLRASDAAGASLATGRVTIVR